MFIKSTNREKRAGYPHHLTVARQAAEYRNKNRYLYAQLILMS